MSEAIIIPNYKKEYENLLKENFELKQLLEKYQKALLNICLNKD